MAFFVVMLLFGFFCGWRGFCHRTESDLFLFLFYENSYLSNQVKDHLKKLLQEHQIIILHAVVCTMKSHFIHVFCYTNGEDKRQCYAVFF